MPQNVEQMTCATEPASSQHYRTPVGKLFKHSALTRHVAPHTVCETYRAAAVPCHQHADAMQGAWDACAVVTVEGAARRVCRDTGHAALQCGFQPPSNKRLVAGQSTCCAYIPKASDRWSLALRQRRGCDGDQGTLHLRLTHHPSRRTFPSWKTLQVCCSGSAWPEQESGLCT